MSSLPLFVQYAYSCFQENNQGCFIFKQVKRAKLEHTLSAGAKGANAEGASKDAKTAADIEVDSKSREHALGGTGASATSKTKKFHPTGTVLGYKGKAEKGLTLHVEILKDASEFPEQIVVFMDKKGRLKSMDGDDLEHKCAPPLYKMLQKSVLLGNTVVRYRQDDSGMQNGVHEDVLFSMIERAQEKDEDLDDDVFAGFVHDLVFALEDKFECVDNCTKTCCQHADLQLFVHQCD